MNESAADFDLRLRNAEASAGISSDVILTCIARILRDQHVQGKLLDFGSGQGDFSTLLHHQGESYSITCADIIDRPSSLPEQFSWIRQDLNEPLDCADQSFDIVVSSEVIEHLENPRSVIRDWYRVLRPGGCLIFSTPNNESWRSIVHLIFRGCFWALSDQSYPAHITALLRKDVERMLAEVGFQAPTFYFTDCGSIPGVTRFTWQTVSLKLLKGLRFSDNFVSLTNKPS